MKIEYNKETRTIEITEVEEYLLANPSSILELYIDDTLIGEIIEDYNYLCVSDGIRKVEVKDTILDVIVVSDSVLTIEYSKDRNRTLLVSILDNEQYRGVGHVYVNNRKIIQEIENSFYSSIPERAEQLIKALKW